MDDSLERPSVIPKLVLEEQEEQSSGEEDDGPDWTKLPSGSSTRPVIPKRGEKDYEPKPGGGSGLQLHVLDRARSAMFNAIKSDRGASNKSMSYAVWHPDLSRAHVIIARGIHFSSMGHSVPRPSTSTTGDLRKLQKRLELLPEETLYLVERGALWCWKESDLRSTDFSGKEDDGGPPMSVQQAYAEMIGTENLTLEKYQVFAYLKRLGYVVTRADPPTPFYPVPPPLILQTASSSIWLRLFPLLSAPLVRFSRLFTDGFNWWKPLRISRWLHHNMDYPSIFKSLRFIPSGHNVPLHATITAANDLPRSPYHIFYNLYKPSTPFKRTAPPPPEFSIVVVNARTTPMPSLQELTALYDILPEQPTPLPRQKAPPPDKIVTSPPTAGQLSIFRRIWSWLFGLPQGFVHSPAVRKPHPFMAIKAGKKTVVIAAVDAGIISFFRFGQGQFSDWPMV